MHNKWNVKPGTETFSAANAATSCVDVKLNKACSRYLNSGHNTVIQSVLLLIWCVWDRFFTSDLLCTSHFPLHWVLKFIITTGSSFGSTVTFSIPAACVNHRLVCSQSCFSDQLCFSPCAARRAVSKSINMWKEHTSLWGAVHIFLVRSKVRGRIGKRRKQRGKGVRVNDRKKRKDKLKGQERQRRKV